MKKFLLTLAAAAICTAVSAEEVTFNLNDVKDTDLTGGEWIEETYKADGSVNAAKHYEPVGTLTIDGYTFATKMLSEKGTKPAFYYPTSTTAADKAQKTLRAYKDTELTFTAPAGMTMGTVTFAGSGNKATLAGVKVSTGKLIELTGSQIVWTGEANSFTLTLDGTVRIASVTVSTEGQGGGDEPVGDYTTYLAETDANGLEGWTIDNVDLDPDLEYVWSWKSYNNLYFLNGSAFIANTAYAAEAYAISPVIDLAGVAEPECSFDHAAKYQTTIRSLCGIVVREAGTKDWTALEIPTWPEAGAWTFVNSGAISLKAFAGKKVEVAFKYLSNTTGADTWEIRNLKFNVKGVTPPTPPTPTVETAPYVLANAIVDGTYLFAIGDEAASNIAESATYGRFSLTSKDVNVAGNTITAPTAYGVKITKAANGYTLVDTFGRYLGMDVKYLTSFQLYTELNDGCYWDITLAADGTATIVNQAAKCTVCQSKGSNGSFYTNVAPADLAEVAAGDYNLPKLYLATSGAAAAVEVDNAAPAVFYNLQGVQVKGELTPGLYIRRQGNSATKVLVK